MQNQKQPGFEPDVMPFKYTNFFIYIDSYLLFTDIHSLCFNFRVLGDPYISTRSQNSPLRCSELVGKNYWLTHQHIIFSWYLVQRFQKSVFFILHWIRTSLHQVILAKIILEGWTKIHYFSVLIFSPFQISASVC